MPWRQKISPNVNIACRPGWCEEYVRKTYGQPAKFPTATAAWEGNEDKHPGDRNQPGVAVPVYWAVANEPAGHVAVWLPDGSVWSASHPTSTSPMRFANLEAIERYYSTSKYKLTYRGWGSFVSHAQVAEWFEPPKPPEPTPEPTPQPQGPQIGDRVTTTATTDAGNGKPLNLAIINDGQSVWTENNSKGNAVLRKGGIVRTQVPINSLRKA